MTFQSAITTPVITTDRFTLRALDTADAGLIDMHAGDKRVAVMTPDIPHPLPPGATQAMIEAAQNASDSETWCIDGTVAELGSCVGTISLNRMDREQSEISYWVAPSFWKSGIATEAVKTLVQANPQGCKTIFGSVFQDNPGSARVLTNTGFDYLGDAEAFCVARNAVVPTWTYTYKVPET